MLTSAYMDRIAYFQDLSNENGRVHLYSKLHSENGGEFS